MIAPGQGSATRARGRQLRQLDDRRPVGRGARPRARARASASSPPTSTSPARTRSARSCRASPTASPAPTAGPRRSRPDGHRRQARAPDKRRMILDAAVRVFARQGFHHCRVSDVADEAGVAYGLVYHYFDSKEEILNTLFLERWQIMLDAIGEIDARDLPVAREAALGRRLHHRLVPARPRPDEGDHRRGHARGELVRRPPPRRDPRGLRGHRRHRRGRPRGGLVQVGHPRRVRGHVLLRRDRAAAHRLDLRGAAAHRRGVRAAPRTSSSRRSAAGSRMARTSAPAASA